MKRYHYAWTVCFGGALALFVAIGLGVNMFGVYHPYIISHEGFSNAQGSWITTIRSVTMLVGMFTATRMCSRFGIRTVMAAGTALVGMGCFCFCAAKEFLTYCIGAALTGIGASYGGMLPLAMVTAHWFQSRRSLALGLASGGSGVATIVMPSVITWAIENCGMKSAFLGEGILVLVLSAAVWCIVRDAPADMKMSPYQIEALRWRHGLKNCLKSLKMQV